MSYMMCCSYMLVYCFVPIPFLCFASILLKIPHIMHCNFSRSALFFKNNIRPQSRLQSIYCLEAALARSARASRRLNLASWITPGRKIVLVWVVLLIGRFGRSRLTGIGIAGEVASVLDEGGALVVTAGDGVAADGADDGGVGEGGLGSDDGVGDVVVDGLKRMIGLVQHFYDTCKRDETLFALSECKKGSTYGVLLLLDLNLGAVLESPLDNVGLLGGTLDVLRGAEGRPELGEVLDLDQVPDGGERGANDGRLADGGGGGDGRHCKGIFGGLLEGVWVCVVGIEEKKVCCGVFYAKASVCCCWICNELAPRAGAVFSPAICVGPWQILQLYYSTCSSI
jgi:hypothetical protein